MAVGAIWATFSEEVEALLATEGAASIDGELAWVVKGTTCKASTEPPTDGTAGTEYVACDVEEDSLADFDSGFFASVFELSELDFSSAGAVTVARRLAGAGSPVCVEVKLSLSTSPFTASKPCSRRKALLAACAALIRGELPAFVLVTDSGIEAEIISLAGSVAVPGTGPNAVSSDCQPERKSCPAEAADEEKMDVGLPSARMPGAAPRALPKPGVPVTPLPISIAAAAVMQEEKADSVPKRDRCGLEHCQDWDRQFHFRKTSTADADSP
ncbi:MAG: hypothetical protein WAN35_08545 [Terracidiphilus sp.]